MLKNILTSGSVALVVAILVSVLVGGNHQSATFGGITNYDSLQAGVSLMVGTSTTAQEITASGSGTTTIAAFSTGTNRASCINLTSDGGTTTRAYISGTSWVIAAGTCK